MDDIRAIVFDVNGTLVRILTDEGMPEIFRAAAHVLTYQGIDLHRDQVQEMYFRILREQQRTSEEHHPEFDAVAIWRAIVQEHRTAFTDALPEAKREQLPLFLAELARGISRRRLTTYPHAHAVLGALRRHCPLAVVTDGQSAHARGELHKVRLLHYFDPVVVSGDHGFRKPDERLFRLALDALEVEPAQALYVGNDMYRDIFGAREAGMATVRFASDQGAREHLDCVPDHTIHDLRELLSIVGLPWPDPVDLLP